jgi:hypothetical protein
MNLHGVLHVTRGAIVVTGLLMTSLGVLQAQGPSIPRDATLYIEELDNDLDGYLRAEMTKEKVPLRVALRREDAHLVLTGTSTAEQKRSWHQGWLTADQDRTSGNVMVFDRASRQLLWAGEAGDRSLWWGAMARGGQRKVASRLVKNLKKAIGKTASALPPPPPLSPEETAAPIAADTATLAPGAPSGRAPGSAALKNADVLKMVSVGLADSVIIQAIDATSCKFNVSPDALVELKKGNVSDAVISAMIRAMK